MYDPKYNEYRECGHSAVSLAADGLIAIFKFKVLNF